MRTAQNSHPQECSFARASYSDARVRSGNYHWAIRQAGKHGWSWNVSAADVRRTTDPFSSTHWRQSFETSTMQQQRSKTEHIPHQIEHNLGGGRETGKKRSLMRRPRKAVSCCPRDERGPTPGVHPSSSRKPDVNYNELDRSSISTYLSTEQKRSADSMAFHVGQSKFGSAARRNPDERCTRKQRTIHGADVFSALAACHRHGSPRAWQQRVSNPRCTTQGRTAASKCDHGDGSRAFLTMSLVASEEEVLNRFENTAMVMSFQDTDKISILCNSGVSTHITPWLPNLTAPYPVHRTCTFQNKRHLRVLAVGDLTLKATPQGLYSPVSVVLQGCALVPQNLSVPASDHRCHPSRRRSARNSGAPAS